VKHTPGPWTVRLEETWWEVQGKGGEAIALNGSEYGDFGVPSEHEANARLIAASPDLLDALQCLEEDLHAVMSAELVKHFGASRNKARAALAKAEGR